MKKEIKIRCKGSHYFKLNELHILQDTESFCLKELSKEGFQKLATSLFNNGFWFPFFFWYCKRDKKKYYVDGTQRDKVLLELQKNGYTDSKEKHWEIIPPDKFPAVEIFADNKKEAYKAILAQTSAFGKITHEGLYEYLETNKLDFNKIKLELDLPDINFSYFAADFYEDNTPDEIPNVDIEPEGGNLNEYLVVYFHDKKIFQEIKDKIKIKGLNRQCSWEDLRNNFEKVRDVQDSDTE